MRRPYLTKKSSPPGSLHSATRTAAGLLRHRRPPSLTQPRSALLCGREVKVWGPGAGPRPRRPRWYGVGRHERRRRGRTGAPRRPRAAAARRREAKDRRNVSLFGSHGAAFSDSMLAQPRSALLCGCRLTPEAVVAAEGEVEDWRRVKPETCLGSCSIRACVSSFLS